jgi:hypothetical protein
MTVRSVLTPAILTLAILATAGCGVSRKIKPEFSPPPLVDGFEVAPLDELPLVAREFYEAFGPINDSLPTPLRVRGSGVFVGRAVIGSDGGALFAFGDARMEVDFDSRQMTARFDNFQNHDADGVPTEALAGALEVPNGRTSGARFRGDLAGQLSGASDVFDVSGRVEGQFGDSGAAVMAGRMTGKVSGSATGPASGLFYGSRE